MSPSPSDSTECRWTIETLREHGLKLLAAQRELFDARFSAIEKSTEAALRAAETAVLKAETAAEKRFESVNEFRNTLSDQQRNLMPRSEVAVVAGALSDKISALEQSLNSKVGGIEKQVDAMKAEALGIKGGWGYAVGAIGFFLAIGSLIMLGVRFVMDGRPP